MDRRRFLGSISGAVLSALAPAVYSAAADDRRLLPRRPIPGSNASLPIIGLGNSNAFREGDLETSLRVIRTLAEHGGAYIDCAGPSRFVVAEAVAKLGLAGDMFLGTYFSGADEKASRADAARLLRITGRPSLDLMHGYPEDAVPNWDTFRAWRDDGLTRYIGIARHVEAAYPAMIGLMKTGTPDFLQVNYSPLETEADDEVLPMAADLGVAVTINRPFINGRYFDIVRGHALPEWAAEFDCESWAQFSLKFILSHPAVTCVLTETANPRHMLDNIGAGFGRVPDDAMRRRMVEHIRSLT